MKTKEGWDGLGQIWAALTAVQTQCREICRVAGVTPEILVWLTTTLGRAIIESVVVGIIIGFRLRHVRRNDLVTDYSAFEDLVKACHFEGRSLNVKGINFPSPGFRAEQSLKFREVGVDTHVWQDEATITAFLASKGLRPATPVEFLLWLKVNPEAGVEYQIWCPKAGLTSEFAYCGRCGGGGRGLHASQSQPTSPWPFTTMFLGVEI